MYLPNLPNDDGIRKFSTLQFAGYHHTAGAKNGDIWDETNITSDYYPVLAPRRPRYLQRTLTAPNGFYCHDGLFWVDGTKFYADGVEKGTVENSRKTFCSLGKYIIILPDKAYYNTADGTFGSIESATPSISYKLTGGTYADEDAEANTLEATGVSSDFDFADYFKEGDAVAIGDDPPLIVREIDGKKLRFYPETFAGKMEQKWRYTVESGLAAGDYCFLADGKYHTFRIVDAVSLLMVDGAVLTWKDHVLKYRLPGGSTDITISLVWDGQNGTPLRFSLAYSDATGSGVLKRTMPDMDFLCENENRLWGCKGDTIYASKLGDPFNWNVFDGVSTDSYAVDVGSVGDFTGACSFLGYPCFFKEENIYKVYGDKPSNFQVMGSASLGTAEGCGRSFAIAGETLFYLSRGGVVAYSGGVPSNIAAAFGTERYTDAVGGSDGAKYYISMKDTASVWHTFVYDTRCGLWSREDNLHALDFGWNTELYALAADGKLWLCGNPRSPSGTQESAVQSVVEFADFTEDASAPKYGANKKGIGKIQLRVELDTGATLQIQIKLDSEATWTDVKTLTAEKKRSYYLPIVPRRCDHFRIRLIGSGDWKLYALTRESYSGSEL